MLILQVKLGRRMYIFIKVAQAAERPGASARWLPGAKRRTAIVIKLARVLA